MTPGGDDDGRANLEDSFFAEPRAGLRERLRKAERDRTRQMETLAEVSGIEDVEVLEKLVLLGIRSETLAALTLYPLVAVAWADGDVDRHEQEAVLRGAEECGVAPGSVAFDLIAGWLDEQPDALLLGAWRALVGELVRRVIGICHAAPTSMPGISAKSERVRAVHAGLGTAGSTCAAR